MRDFTLKIYKKLLAELLKTGYGFVTFAEYIQDPDKKERIIILRHDVERLPCQALKMAQIEHERGVKASYYFCCHRYGFDESFIRAIATLRHEIGYHYEDLSRSQGNFEMAIAAFEKNLSSLRKLAVVKTICMHGSPLGEFDNRKLWEKYKYQDFVIIGEPYFDVDYTKVSYLTDIGCRWNGNKVNIRDRINVKHGTAEMLKIKGTADLIRAIVLNALPDRILLNAHPHRWFDFGLGWVKELLIQNIKNTIKATLVYFRHD